MIASTLTGNKIIVEYFYRSEIQGHHAGCLSNLKAASLSQFFNNIEFVAIVNSIPTKAGQNQKVFNQMSRWTLDKKGCHVISLQCGAGSKKTYHCHCHFKWECVQTDSISEKSLSRKIEFHTTGIPGGWWSYQWENKSCTLSDNKMLKRWDRQKLSQISKKLSHLVHVVTSKDFNNFPSGNKVATCNSQWLDLTIVCDFHGTGNLEFHSETISCFFWHSLHLSLFVSMCHMWT